MSRVLFFKCSGWFLKIARVLPDVFDLFFCLLIVKRWYPVFIIYFSLVLAIHGVVVLMNLKLVVAHLSYNIYVWLLWYWCTTPEGMKDRRLEYRMLWQHFSMIESYWILALPRTWTRATTVPPQPTSSWHSTPIQGATTFLKETQKSLYAAVHSSPLRIYVTNTTSTTTTTRSHIDEGYYVYGSIIMVLLWILKSQRLSSSALILAINHLITSLRLILMVRPFPFLTI